MQRAFSGPLRKMMTLHCATIVHRSERLVMWFENRPSPQSHRLYCFPPYSDPYPSLSGDFHMFRASNSPFHPPVSLWNQPLPQPLRFHQGANEVIVLPVVPRQRWSPRKVLAKLLWWMMGSSLGKIMGYFTIENSDLSQWKWGFDGIFMIFMDIHTVMSRDQRIWLGFRLLYLDWLRISLRFP